MWHCTTFPGHIPHYLHARAELFYSWWNAHQDSGWGKLVMARQGHMKVNNHLLVELNV